MSRKYELPIAWSTLWEAERFEAFYRKPEPAPKRKEGAKGITIKIPSYCFSKIEFNSHEVQQLYLHLQYPVICFHEDIAQRLIAKNPREFGKVVLAIHRFMKRNMRSGAARAKYALSHYFIDQIYSRHEIGDSGFDGNVWKFSVIRQNYWDLQKIDSSPRIPDAQDIHEFAAKCNIPTFSNTDINKALREFREWSERAILNYLESLLD